VVFAAWAGLSLRRLRPQVWCAAGLLAVTLWVVVWGGMQDYVHSRIILVFNAERYIYHGFLLAFPVVALLFSRYWERCRGRAGMRVVLVLLLVVPFFRLPNLAYESRNLLTDEPVVISGARLKAYSWIRAKTPVNGVFLQGPIRSPDGRERFERTLPALTGRCLYVADIYNIWGYADIPAYEHGNRLKFVRDAFAGRYNPAALSESCLARGIDYVLLPDATPSSSPAVFRDPWFETIHRIGSVGILRPAPPIH